MKLSDYFQPLNIKNIIIFLLVIIFFDILGTFVKKIVIKNKNLLEETRIINWLIGLGFFIFFWFIVGFFIRPTQIAIIISGVLLITISLYSYIRNYEYLNLFNSIKTLFPFILIIVPFLPALFVKASLPPYYSDEMAYHFISPYAVENQLNIFWQFSGGVLGNAPKLIDTLFILIFSLTKTYSIARLILFSILATVIIFTGHFIRKRFNLSIGLLFVLLFFSLPQEIVFTSTIGFVDISTYSFFILGLVFSSHYLIDKKIGIDVLYLSTIFWAMSLGSKYTTINVFLATIFVLVTISFKKIKEVFINNKSVLLKIGLLFIVFGGYWYLKNFIVYGNPIYPFIFPCWGKYAIDCNTGSSFFGEWTTKVNVENLNTIIHGLLPGGKWLSILLLISLSTFLFKNIKKEKLLLIFYLLIFVLEMISIKFMSGFQIRYHQHMQVLLLLPIVIFPFVFMKVKIIPKFIKLILILVFIIPIIKNYFLVVKSTNSLNFVNWNEINYSIGKDDIYDWIRVRLPRVADAIFWCQNPPGGQVFLARYDPDMIWYEDEGFMRSFLLNCSYGNPSIDISSEEKLIKEAKEKEIQFWTATINPCIDQNLVISKRKGESEEEIEMRRENNRIVCKSNEILPNLYYFDYKKL